MWLPDRPSEPVIDNWPPKSLPIYADFDYEPSGLPYRLGGVAVPRSDIVYSVTLSTGVVATNPDGFPP